MIRVDWEGSTRISHHSSNFGSGKSGACTGPIASLSCRFLRTSCTLTVAISPTTRTSSSSSASTVTLAFISTLLTCEQKASMSASCCGSIIASPFRCSGSLCKNSARLVMVFLPLWQCFRTSSLKNGICSNWELFTSSACTRHRRNSIMACVVWNHSRMHAISIIASVIFREYLRSWSQSLRSSGDMRWWSRCMCAQTRNPFFTMSGTLNWRFLCSTMPCGGLRAFMCVLSVGRASMLRLSAEAATSSGQFFTRDPSLMWYPRNCSVSIMTPFAAKFFVFW
mmetsp:Transcript_38839/g.109767  ORF Transcript_38839/g.109767 Transcript_38839/m.109767 type:complete len:281 (-) Transcript_38839:826-1668(-)